MTEKVSVGTLFLAIMTWLLILGCSNEETTPPDEEFYGTYMVRDTTFVIDAAAIDSVVFSVRAQRAYDLLFYKSSPVDPLVDFCAHSGSLAGFGNSVFTMTPTQIHQVNCDSLRIPRGDFQADFVTHGDTIYFEKRSGDSLYQFKLLQ